MHTRDKHKSPLNATHWYHCLLYLAEDLQTRCLRIPAVRSMSGIAAVQQGKGPDRTGESQNTTTVLMMF